MIEQWLFSGIGGFGGGIVEDYPCPRYAEQGMYYRVRQATSDERPVASLGKIVELQQPRAIA